MNIRRAIGMWRRKADGFGIPACLTVFLLFAPGVTADTQCVWIAFGNSITTLVQQTGIQGDSIVIPWKEGQFNTNYPGDVCGGREEIGIIRPREVPPLTSIALFSFNEIFTPSTSSLPRSITPETAHLWIYVTQAVGTQQVILCAMPPEDRDWDPALSTTLQKGEEAPWSAGSVSSCLGAEYGRFDAPLATGWFQVPVNLTNAISDYRAGLIGGIAMLSAADPTREELCNFYFVAGEAADPSNRPALLLTYQPLDRPPTLPERSISYDAGTGYVMAWLAAPEADAIRLDATSADYAFGGNWSLALPASPQTENLLHEIILDGLGGASTQRLVRVSEGAAASIRYTNEAFEVFWHGATSRYYSIHHTVNPVDIVWNDLLDGRYLGGAETDFFVTNISHELSGFYRVAAHYYEWED